jgi:hypothetical protein
MPDTYPALCKTTTTTTGTADYTVSTVNNTTAHRTPKQAVADGSLSDGDTVHYLARDNTVTGDASFEEGLGIYTDSTNEISRLAANVIDGSSGPGTLVVWPGSGQRDIYILGAIPSLTARTDRANTFAQDQTFSALINLTETSTATAPTTTEYPNAGDTGFHHDTSGGRRDWVHNDGGTIFRVQMTI